MKGYRYIDNYYSSRPEVGDILPTSFVWDGDEQTDEELAGTCCFDSLEALKEYAKWSKGCGVLVIVEGEMKGWGDLANEVIIADAEVLEVIEW